jgi:starch phosphorylase
LLQNPERLARLLNDPHRPVQILYAGKAHPRDQYGKQLIQAIIELAKRPEFRRHIVFIEDYDMATARYMVQGCDVWLNTPLRPQEASGTSGMKAMANGALNVSTLDGWWDEAWEIGVRSGVQLGWAIGKGESYQDPGYQDRVEAEALYQLLETDIVPTFYERRADGLPRKWVERMKGSLTKLGPQFNMHRQVMQYADEYYLVAHERHCNLHLDDAARAKALAAWKKRVDDSWPRVRIVPLPIGTGEVDLGSDVNVNVEVALDALTPDDVSVEMLTGRVDAHDQLQEQAIIAMECGGRESSGNYKFRAVWQPSKSGLCGYAIRVLPKHRDAVSSFFPLMIIWADGVPTAAGELVSR